MPNKIDEYHAQVAAELIEKIKAGTAPWQKPWEATELFTAPINGVTNRRYRGGNFLYLAMKDYPDPRWYTFNQAQNLGLKVRKGAKATRIEYWEIKNKKDSLEETKEESGDEKKSKAKFIHRFYYVFNGTQIEGLEPYPQLEKKEQTWTPVERAEMILRAVNVPLYNDQVNRAYYSLTKDEIHLPKPEAFKTSEDYYSTALHELGHSTGHETRLNRDLKHRFGSIGYAKEELRAEISSLMLCRKIGIPISEFQLDQHAAYVKNWIQVLQEDPNEIFRAAAAAEKIQTFILEKEQNEALKEKAEKLEIKNLATNKEEAQRQIDKAAKYAAIAEFITPKGSKLTAEMLYKQEAQKSINQKKSLVEPPIVAKMLAVGISKTTVKNTLLKYSPLAVDNSICSLKMVNKVANQPAIKKKLCQNDSQNSL